MVLSYVLLSASTPLPPPSSPSSLGQPMICKLLTDLRSSGFAMHSPPLTRYSGLSDLDAGWGYTGGF